MNGILAKKLGMTQLFLEDGQRAVVTVLQAGPCKVVQRKTVEIDGYEAIQIGFLEQKASRIDSAMTGHFAKAGVAPTKHLAEFSAANPQEWEVGTSVDVTLFEGVKLVDVIGVSKGHGFSGAIKRHNFRSGPRAHGSKNVRELGSVGSNSYPARTWPGKRMAGQYGNVNVYVRNLEVVKIDTENNLLFVKGAVPGPANGLIKVRKA
jgi:large subunit ribosomal protein L3